MNRRQFLSLCLVGWLASLVTSGCRPGRPLAAPSTTSAAKPVTITVSAAASLQDALDAIASQFQAAHPSITVDYNFGSSGALQRQIEQGAPADIFFSAAPPQMDALSAKELLIPNSRQDIVTNRLVLIAPTGSHLNITNMAQLQDTAIRRFAVGEFRSVPAGQYAEQVFETLDILEPLQSKFVFGNNVRNVLAAVESGHADLGMVYATDAALSQQVKVLTTAPQDAHPLIVYPIAVVQGTAQAEAAQTFIDFLQTETAQTTFEEFGFGRV